MTPLRLLLTFGAAALLVASVSACPTQGEDDDDAADDDDTVDLPVIPDPGGGTDDWGLGINDVCCSTPETAHPVGTATMDAGYIQGVIDTNLNFFYVFRSAAGMTSFTFPMYFEEVHLHDGEGLRFGDEITPSGSGDFDVTWDVSGDHVYVVEIISETEGFF